MRRFLAALSVVILLAGCAPLVTIWPVEPEKIELLDSFKYEGVQERMTGEPVFHYMLNAKARPGFIATEDFQPPPDTNHSPSGLPVPLIKAGSEWVAVGSLREPDGNGYVCMNVKERPMIVYSPALAWEFCLLVDKEGAAYGTAFCEDEDARKFRKEWLGKDYAKDLHRELNYRTTMDKHARRSGAVGAVFIQPWDKNPPKGLFKTRKIYSAELLIGRSIVYAGKTGSILRFIYREWLQQDMELTFDIRESNLIGISGIQFEVVDATSSSIKFKIITPTEHIKEMQDEQEQRLKEKDMRDI